MTAAFDGTQSTDTAVAAAPFYLSWDPTSSRIVYLGGSATADIELGLVDVAASTTDPDRCGQPVLLLVGSEGEATAGARGDRPARPARDRRHVHAARRSPGTVQRSGLDRGRTHAVLRDGGGGPATAGRPRRRHRSTRDPREVRRRDHVRRESRRRTRRVPGHPRRAGAGRAALRDRSADREDPSRGVRVLAGVLLEPRRHQAAVAETGGRGTPPVPVERVGGRDPRSRPTGSCRASSSAATTSSSSSSTRRA